MHPDDALALHFQLNAGQKKALEKLKLRSVRDLLYHFPSRYSDLSVVKLVRDLVPGDRAVVYGRIKSVKVGKAFRKKMPLGQAVLEDVTGTIKIVWFNQPYLAKMFAAGSYVKVSGKVASGSSGIYLGNPEIEHTEGQTDGAGDSLFRKDEVHGAASLYPVYPESRGITSRFFYHTIGKALKGGVLEKIEENIPQTILKKYNLPTLTTALVWLHAPRKEAEAVAARKRFAFEEVFFIQLVEQKKRLEYEAHKTFAIAPEQRAVDQFLERFPFSPTKAQRHAITEIFKDFASGKPMLRLLEGDVGSGKTLVAALAAYATVMTKPKGQDFGRLEVAYMAPTEILAKQHFASFMEYFKGLGVQIGLITGSGCKKFPSKVSPGGATDISKNQLLKWVANGEIPILIGTHALIQKGIQFKNLALAIIDEQHRFGTKQRGALGTKGRSGMPAPHLLSMTATPIPRTLALTIYGNLDLTLLDEMPPGRKQIKTEIVLPGKREHVYQKVRDELAAGRQAYVICPRINEPDPTKELALMAKSAKAEAVRLDKEVFPEYRIAVLHGKMKDSEKEETMEAFARHEIDILVSTSLVEVGVNVPNATVIIIEGAERFGLAQLHQLRGRVIRSTYQAYCFLFSETKNAKSLERLKAIEKAKNGFELAELDLMLRGAGELGGEKQWGLSDLAMEAMRNLKMVEAARAEAHALISADPELMSVPKLKTALSSRVKPIHFE